MTRKDYILIANALRKTREAFQSHIDGGPAMLVIESVIEEAANKLAVEMVIDNPRFNGVHFLAVVRGEKDLNSKPARSTRPKSKANSGLVALVNHAGSPAD